MPALFRRFAQPRRPAPYHGDVMTGVLSQYRKEGDRSRFGLAQAITAFARDVQDPELKWDLEKLGGAGARGRFRRATEESAVALVEEQLLRTA